MSLELTFLPTGGPECGGDFVECSDDDECQTEGVGHLTRGTCLPAVVEEVIGGSFTVLDVSGSVLRAIFKGGGVREIVIVDDAQHCDLCAVSFTAFNIFTSSFKSIIHLSYPDIVRRAHS